MENIDWSLIVRHLRNELPPEDEAVFMNWLDESSKHRIYYERLQREWDNDKLYQTDLPKVLAGFDNFIRQRRKRHLVRRWWLSGVAAVLLCGLGVAFLYLRDAEPVSSSQPLASTLSDKGMAMLVLADGTSIRLDKMADTSTVKLQEVEIDREEEVVTFSGKQDEMAMTYNTILIPRGRKYEAVLEDGTRVWLNAETQLKIPAVFAADERRVILSGEAYFEVAHQFDRPFIVETDLGCVRVFGTEFNVRRYSTDSGIKTTLVNGSVGFACRGEDSLQYLKITPGYQVYYSVTSIRQPEVRKVNVSNEIAWKNQQFSFERCTLEYIMQEVGRAYDIDVVFADDALKQLEFTVNLKRCEDIRVLLDYFEEVCEVQFDIQGKGVIITRK